MGRKTFENSILKLVVFFLVILLLLFYPRFQSVSLPILYTFTFRPTDPTAILRISLMTTSQLPTPPLIFVECALSRPISMQRLIARDCQPQYPANLHSAAVTGPAKRYWLQGTIHASPSLASLNAGSCLPNSIGSFAETR